MHLSIVIPAYNEQDRIGATLAQYTEYFSQHNTEFIVILNGCRDNTIEVVEAFAKQYPGIVYYKNIPQPIGKGGAVHQGFGMARGDYVGFVDADASTSPAEFARVYQAGKSADGAIASRWKKGSVIKNRSTLRHVISIGFITLVKLLFWMPYADTQCGAKIFKREVVTDVLSTLRVHNMAFDVELLYALKKRGYHIIEVPTVWVDSSSDSMALGSPFKLAQNIISMFITLIQIRFRSY